LKETIVKFHRWMTSPLGRVLLRANETALTGVFFERQQYMPGDELNECLDHAVLKRAAEQLGEYFAGERRDFDLPLAPAGTEFQKRVWEGIYSVKYGETITYGELARRAAIDISGSRAVGAATGRNPVGIIIPCHRIIGANGKLTGYAGGLDKKRALLGLESSAARNVTLDLLAAVI
jgi:methylated-DNA-[protein]-cysteine S-methyltransferase